MFKKKNGDKKMKKNEEMLQVVWPPGSRVLTLKLILAVVPGGDLECLLSLGNYFEETPMK